MTASLLALPNSLPTDEQRLVLEGVTWQQYDALVTLFMNQFPISDYSQVEDDRLRLIFTCCHPALAPEAQVALTLREVCGLTTEEIASAFLISPSTPAQHIVRAKAKIRDAVIPYQVPSKDDLPDRVEKPYKASTIRQPCGIKMAGSSSPISPVCSPILMMALVNCSKIPRLLNTCALLRDSVG